MQPEPKVGTRRWAHKGGLNTKIHLAVDAHGMPVRFFVTETTVADCSMAEKLIAEFQAEYLLVDRGYDTDAIIQRALLRRNDSSNSSEEKPQISSHYDKDIYSQTTKKTKNDIYIKFSHLMGLLRKLCVSLFKLFDYTSCKNTLDLFCAILFSYFLYGYSIFLEREKCPKCLVVFLFWAKRANRMSNLSIYVNML